MSATGAFAGTWTWNGGTGIWNLGSNWDLGTIPVSASTTTLTFGGSLPYTSTDDLAASFTLNRLILQSSAATASVLGASSSQVLSFSDDGGSVATIRQGGSGDFTLGLGIAASNLIHFDGAGTGITRINGLISGSGGLSFDAGRWQVTNVGNTFTGGITIKTGATLEAVGTPGPVTLNHGGANTMTILGAGGPTNPITVDGGTLKITTAGTTATGGYIKLGAGFPLAFGPNGGLFDLTNDNPAAPTQHAGTLGLDTGTNSGGDLALTLNNTAAAVIRFNGGQAGLSNLTNPQSGDWSTGGNTLRVQSYTGSGPVRFELLHGALARAGTASTGLAVTIASPTTYRGVLGGDSSSGAAGTINTGTSLNTSRLFVDRSDYTYSGGLVFQDAIQVAAAGSAARLTGGITLDGVASGHPAMVTFTGRTTGNSLTMTIQDPLVGGNGQQPLWLGSRGVSGVTIHDGAVANFDSRIRIDFQNHSGVFLDGNAVLMPGGTLRIGQSISSFTLGFATGPSAGNSGDIILYGDIEGRGSSSSESVLDLRLPVPSPSGTNLNGIPQTLTSATLASGARPFGGLDAKPENALIVNGTGFGGLRIETRARPNALFSVTGSFGGAPKPDPVDNVTKMDGYLTPARLAGITGSGGYLTVAPIGQTWSFPSGGEWVDGVTVGARVTDHNPNGTDISFSQLPGFSHNIAVDAGATVDFGALPFNFGPAVPVAGIGTLQGKGTVLSAGGLNVTAGGRVAPGTGDIGSLAIENVSFAGALEIDVNGAAADLLSVAGNLVLGATSQLSVPGTSVLAPRNYKIATAGTLTGTFSSTPGLPGTHSVSYTRPGEIWISYSAAPNRVWTGATNGAWDQSTANWVGPTVFADTEKVTFDDSAPAGSRNVTVTGGNVEPTSITVNTAGNYSLTSAVGAAIIGTGELVKTGTGTLTLSGPAAFQGGVLVQQGVLATSAAESIPDMGKVFVSTGAQLNLGAAETINELIVSGSVTSSSPLHVTTLTLADATTFQAPLVLHGAVLKSGAPLTLSQTVDLSGGARTFQVASSSAPELTLGGVVSNGSLIKTGAGTLALGGTNLYQGGTTVETGALRAIGAGALPANRDVTVNAAGTVDLNGFAHTLGVLSSAGTVITGGAALTVSGLSGTGGTLSLGAGNLLVNQSGNSRYDGAIATTGSLSKTGAGSLTLGGNNTIGAGVVISSGIARMAAPNAGGTGNITVLPGAALVADATIAAQVTLSGGIFGSRFVIQQAGSNADVLLTAGTASVALLADPSDLATRSDLIFDGPLRGSGDLLIQTGTNPLSADNGSGLRLHNTTASDFTGTITAGAGTKFELQTVTPGAFSVMGTGKIVMTAGTATAGRNGTYSQLNLRNNSTGDMILGNNVEITGTGTVNFGPTSTGDVAPVNSKVVLGNLKIGDSQVAAVNKNGGLNQVVQFNSVTLTGGEAHFRPRSSDFGFSATSDLVLGPIAESTPSSGIVMDGVAELTLLGNNSYTGASKFKSGITWLAGANALPSSTALEVTAATVHLRASGGASFSQTVSSLSGGGGGFIDNDASGAAPTLTVNQSIDTIYDGTLSGNLNLLKQGSGTLRLVGSSALQSVVVAGGTLGVGSGTVQGSLTGSITVQNGANLRGLGAIGAVTVETGGSVVVGDPVGVLGTESFTMQPGSTLAFDLNGTLEGAQYDSLNVFGSMTLSGAVTLELQLGFQPALTDLFALVLNDGNDSIAGGGRFVYQGNTLEQGEVFSVTTGGYQQAFEIRYDGNDGNDVVLTAVPEPSVTLLVLGGIAVLGRRRRQGI